MKRGMFRASGTASPVSATIPPVTRARILCDSCSYTGDAAGLLSFYCARAFATANAAVAAASTLVIDTDSNGYVEGAVLTTSDYVLVEDSSGTGWQLESISSVGAVSSSTVSLGLGGNITCSANDRIWIIRVADIHSITTADETVNNLLNLFVGEPGAPVHVTLTGSTGSKFFTGTYSAQPV